MKKLLFITLAIIGICLTLQINGALSAYNPETCPNGPYESPPYTAYCDYVNTVPGDTDPVGDGLCYDINANTDCTPIPDDPPPTTATVLQAGNDFWPNNMYDFRTYHESHPKANLPNNAGSNWIIGLTVHNPAVWDSIGEVNIRQPNSIEDMKYTIKMDGAAVYPWGGQTFNDWSVWLNNLVMLPENNTFEITANDNLGNPIEFDMDGNMQTSVFMTVDIDDPLPPICKIKHMAIKKNGELKMRFTAPYDLRANSIRIRIFDAEGLGMEEQTHNLTPPFEIVKKNGTIVPDKVKVTDIPAIYTGRTGRIEYRVITDTGVLFRGITYFKLPELEDEE